MISAAAGCASPALETGDSQTFQGADEIRTVDQSIVKRQSIGNCWVYAVIGWVESLEKRETGVEQNYSESYISYWHWFEQITGGEVYGTELQTGGHFSEGADLLDNYGLMKEGDFIYGERKDEMSTRQKTALAAIGDSLKNGALKTEEARRDRALVRAELDKAFGLTATMRRRLDATFGRDVSKTLKTGATPAASARIVSPKNIAVATTRASDGTVVHAKLSELIGQNGSGWWRSGPLAFTRVDMPSASSPARMRAFWKRVQRSIHDQAPVVVEWYVDFNALTSSAVFSKQQLTARGPGNQGGHMVVAHDYQARLADGTLYAAGVDVTDPAALNSLLRDDTSIEFLRVKNSWGAYRPDRWIDAPIMGYHDLNRDYLEGDIKTCKELPSGGPDLTQCNGSRKGLSAVYLPAGY